MRNATLVTIALVSLTACSGGGDGGGVTPPPNPTIALSVDRAGETTIPGATFTIIGTLTRGGGYTGTVAFVVEGVPAGVTATAGSPQGSGTTSTVTFTVQVGAGVLAGVYPIVARAQGTGVTAATASFTLTVLPAPDFSIALAPASATINAGSSQAGIAIEISRTNFTEAIAFSLGGTVPAGVSATFTPAAPTLNASSMTLIVAPDAAPGSYQLTIQGTGTAGTRSAPFALTVAPMPDYSLGISSPAATIVQGLSRNDIVVSLTRTNFTGDVALSLAGPVPAGVAASFAPSPATGNEATMTITVDAATPVGTYDLRIDGTGAPGIRQVPFTLTVAPPGSFTLAVAPAGALTLAPGDQDASKTVTIVRTNYNEAIALVAEGLPAGVTASFAPHPVSGNSSVLTLTAAANATVGGPHTITIRGTGPLARQSHPVAAMDLSATASFSLTIAVPVLPLSSANETFRGASVADANWVIGGFGPVVNPGWPGKACLTAGSNTSQLPAPGCGLVVPEAGGQGVLRLTERTTAPAPGRTGFAIYNAPLPLAGGLDITFHQSHYGTVGGFFADGISIFLAEGSVSLTQAGASGGAIGYAPASGLFPGLRNALIGIAFDLFGGFSTALFSCPGDPGGSLRPNSVVVRGPGHLTSGYCRLGVADLTPQGITLHSNTTTRNDILTRIVVDPPSAPSPKVTVFLNGIQVIQVAAPAELLAASTVRLGVAGSTGGLTDMQEVWNLTVNAVVAPGGGSRR